MKWTLGLLLLGAVGCGYRQTKMVACPETGCPPSYASSSPEGLRAINPSPPPAAVSTPDEIAPPLRPLPDTAPPPVVPPEPTPTP